MLNMTIDIFLVSLSLDKNPTDKNFTVVICPRPEIEQPGE